MLTVVTGAAGFIGSHLSAALLRRGDHVIGIDCLTEYYEPALKRSNLASLVSSRRFYHLDADLRVAELASVLEGAGAVFHQAGQPGVRRSWSEGFPDYCGHNILATQRLLEAAKLVGVPRVVYASSSSVYGEAPTYPTRETDLPAPHSPYGMTKLAAEHLCRLYAANWGLSTVSLRYFTVYGPRQRPDMAMRRLVESAFSGEPFPMYGTGAQTRDFTYVDDVVCANLLAADADVAPGTVVNVAGGSSASMSEVVALVERLSGRPVLLEQQDAQPGDVKRTGGAVEEAWCRLGWSPSTPLEAGLAEMVEWARVEFGAARRERALAVNVA